MLMTLWSGIIVLLARRLGHEWAFSDIISVTKGSYVILDDGLALPDIHQDGPKVRKVALENLGKKVVEGQLAGHRVTNAVDDDEFNVAVDPLLIESQCLDEVVAAPL